MSGSKLPSAFLSYAHDQSDHEQLVRRFCEFLRRNGVDARLDHYASEQSRNWADWTTDQLRTADYVLIIVSPQYKQRAEGTVPPGVGLGVAWEARQIKEAFYADHGAAVQRNLVVVLPGCSVGDIPAGMGGRSSTHYDIADFTVTGAERLLRRLHGQEEQAPLVGPRPALPTGPDAAFRLMSDRDRMRTDRAVQLDVRQYLRVSGVSAADLREEGDRRLTAVGIPVELSPDLRRPGAVQDGRTRLLTSGARVGLLTDGAEWQLYGAGPDPLTTLSPATDAGLAPWLEGILATGSRIKPTPAEIVAKLGADSPAYLIDTAELTAVYTRHRDVPSIRLKRNLWAKLLTTALGENFTDEDSLFVDHTLLVITAELIGNSVIGYDITTEPVRALMSGELFRLSQVDGVVEADFFDWISEVPEGEEFVRDLARRLARFDWSRVEQDVMKTLYESIIGRETRKRLGEYYTPDWLAEEIVRTTADDPLRQRVLDPACGSGTFLFHAVRRYLDAAREQGVPDFEAVAGVVTHVIGFDVHPVAVTLARVTYLLAIGLERVRTGSRPHFSVPVYLADSLRWGEEEGLWSHAGLQVSTAETHEAFLTAQPEGPRLSFPESVLNDPDRFDRLVRELAELAVGTRRLDVAKGILGRYGVKGEETQTLQDTVALMRQLHEQGRDHIWAYYVRNLARPAWLARRENRVDVLVGNPPWLSYRYMTPAQQASFRSMSSDRKLWAGAKHASQQDLSALFVARSIELYLRPGGRFGFVMPLAVLSRGHAAGFRAANYPVHTDPVTVRFKRAWDLHQVKPAFFPVPPAAVFGMRSFPGQRPLQLLGPAEVWSGRFATASASWSDAVGALTRMVGEGATLNAIGESPFAARFKNGATIFPQVLFMVEDASVGPLGNALGRKRVHSRRSPYEKPPWRTLPSLEGAVETRFIRPVHLSNSLLPYRLEAPVAAIIPWDGRRILDDGIEELDAYPGLAQWWREAEEQWIRHRSSERLSLKDQLDYRRKLSEQFPAAEVRVIYSASGMYLAAATVTDQAAVIEHKLYWAAADSLAEARYLTAVLNSAETTEAVRPLQGRGEHNPRDFDKYVFQLPIPAYDPEDARHQWLVGLAERAEEVAAAVELPEKRFETQRRVVREALVRDGVAADVDSNREGAAGAAAAVTALTAGRGRCASSP